MRCLFEVIRGLQEILSSLMKQQWNYFFCIFQSGGVLSWLIWALHLLCASSVAVRRCSRRTEPPLSMFSLVHFDGVRHLRLELLGSYHHLWSNSRHWQRLCCSGKKKCRRVSAQRTHEGSVKYFWGSTGNTRKTTVGGCVSQKSSLVFRETPLYK